MKGYEPSLVCPMNYVCTVEYPRGKRVSERIPFSEFVINQKPEAPKRKNRRIEELIERFCTDYYNELDEDQNDDELAIFEEEFDELIEEIKKIYIGYSYRGLMSYLINRAFCRNSNKRNSISNLNRNRPMLLNILYKMNRETFLSCFKTSNAKS